MLGFVDLNCLAKGNRKRFGLDDRVDIDIETLVRFTDDDCFRIIREESHKEAFQSERKSVNDN